MNHLFTKWLGRFLTNWLGRSLTVAALLLASSFGVTTGTGTFATNGYIRVPGGILLDEQPLAGTNVTINLYGAFAWPVTNHSRFQVGTNISATNESFTMIITIDASADGWTLTNVVDTISWATNAYTLKAGLNHLTLTRETGRWTAYLDTAAIPGSQVNGTIDVSRSDLTLKWTGYQDFIYPGRVDGTGCTITTNDYTSGIWGLATYAGTGGTNANYAFYKIGTVPYDIDSTVTMVLKALAFRVSGSDTGSASFSIGFFCPSSSSAANPADFTALSSYVTFTSGTLSSPASGDIFYMADQNLVGWASGVTAGRPLIIGIARDGSDANNDSIAIMGGTIAFGRTQ